MAESEKSNPLADGQAEPLEGDQSLGTIFAQARERRGLSRELAANEARVPANYIQMIESADYGLISDQLYLLPFIRRYAAYLGLDGEEVAMRFVREVQHSEGGGLVRLSDAPELDVTRRRSWSVPVAAAVAFVAALLLVLYIYHRERSPSEAPPAATAVAQPRPKPAGTGKPDRGRSAPGSPPVINGSAHPGY